MPRTTAALVAFVAALCLTRTGWTEQRRIAVLQPDSELVRAVSLSLSPWGLETMRSDAPVPRSSQPEAARVAARLARELEVDALVWITSLGNGSLLWVFDLRTGDVTTRQIPQTPPFDSASAAAVALSVKTVLRSSELAPPEERFGARSTSPPPEQTATTGEAAPAATTMTRESILAAELSAGGHWVGEGELDFRVGLAGVVWFPAARRLGVSLEVSSGPGIRIDTPDYRGRYRELVVGAKARFRLVHLPYFSYVVALGGSAHWAMLRGTLAPDSVDRDVDRYNGSLDLETSLAFKVGGGLYFGVSTGASYSPTYRRYLVAGDPIFAPSPLAANLTGFFGVELF